MTGCRRGDVVLVPVTYIGRAGKIGRPTLVVSAQATGLEPHILVWVLMITSAENQRWPRDVLIDDLGGTGLLDASFVRTAKIVNTELRGAERVGALGEAKMAEVESEVRAILGFRIM